MNAIVRVLVTFFLLLWAVLGTDALALEVSWNVPDGVRIAPLPDDVEVVEVSDTPFDADGRQTAYRVSALEYVFQADGTRTTSQYARDLRTAEAVDADGVVSISFDPSAEMLTLHYLRAVRDGEIVPLLLGAEVAVADLEDDADARIFDTRREITLLARDLRPGDRLEYAFSHEGGLKSLRGSVSRNLRMGYSVPVQTLRHHLRFEDGLTPYWKSHAGAQDPVVSRDGDVTTLTLLATDVAALDVEDDTPNWMFTYPTVQVSTFESWGDVGDLFADNYIIDDTTKSVVADTVAAIADEHMGASARTLAALHHVEDTIRYVATNYGDGGYVPRPVETVLARRFGDCKDVTLLLLSLLDGLGIEASPVLVNTSQKEGLFRDDLPVNNFDHVLVLATVDGQGFLLDATGSHGPGTLATISQPDYGKGVVLRPGASELIDLPTDDRDWFEELSMIIDVTGEAGEITVDNLYHGPEAERIYRWMRRDGKSGVAKEYLEWYQKRFVGLVEEAFDIETDMEANTLRMTARYTLPEIWVDIDNTPGSLELDVTLQELFNAVPDNMSGTRKLARTIGSRERVRQSLDVRLSGRWDLEAKEIAQDNDSFAFALSENHDENANVYSREASFRTKSDFISPETYTATIADIRVANTALSQSIYKVAQSTAASVDAGGVGEEVSAAVTSLTGWVGIVGVLLCLMVGLGLAFATPRRGPS